MEGQTERKPGKVQLALEELGKQISELETIVSQLGKKTEPIRDRSECEEETHDEGPEKQAVSEIASIIVRCTDRVHLATADLERIRSELEI